MRYDEALALENSVVRLADGRFGRIVAWHHHTQAVAVAVAGQVQRVIPVDRLDMVGGQVVERPNLQ